VLAREAAQLEVQRLDRVTVSIDDELEAALRIIRALGQGRSPWWRWAAPRRSARGGRGGVYRLFGFFRLTLNLVPRLPAALRTAFLNRFIFASVFGPRTSIVTRYLCVLFFGVHIGMALPPFRRATGSR
jgi:hypothetical protein